MSATRQNPMAGAYKNAFFNTYRRTYNQILYWLPPLVFGYAIMEWAIER
jgi:ubiquinol-cytochrome c reductase subunit 8